MAKVLAYLLSLGIAYVEHLGMFINQHEYKILETIMLRERKKST